MAVWEGPGDTPSCYIDPSHQVACLLLSAHLEVSILRATELHEQLRALESSGVVIVGHLQHVCCLLVPDQTADLAMEGLDDRVAL